MSVAVGSSIVRLSYANLLPVRSYADDHVLQNSKLRYSSSRECPKQNLTKYCLTLYFLTFARRLMVVISWIAGKPLTLLFDPFESIVMFLSSELLSS